MTECMMNEGFMRLVFMGVGAVAMLGVVAGVGIFGGRR